MENLEQDPNEQEPNERERNLGKDRRNSKNEWEGIEDDQEDADEYLSSDGLVDRNIGEGSEDLYDLEDDDDVLDPLE